LVAMASSASHRRLRKEYAALSKESPPGCAVQPLESNLLHAHFLLGVDPIIFRDTPYEGGLYHGELRFPRNYPLGPPTVVMRTPSGRFVPGAKICFSMSDFHPELWNPMWNIHSIITGLVSFMNSNEITTGGMEATASHRTDLARHSLKHCWENDLTAKKLFGEVLEQIMYERKGLGTSWPPPHPTPPAPPSSSSEAGPGTISGRETAERSEDGTSSDKGKNAAKNKKRKEREKRRKAGRRFITNLSDMVPKFVETIIAALSSGNHRIDVSHYCADHICWRTETLEEYSELVLALKSLGEEMCTLLVESEIGGRPIATFRLTESIQCGPNRIIDVVEIPSPKQGSAYKTGLEHIEFVLTEEGENLPVDSPINDEGQHWKFLKGFVDQHSHVKWNLKASKKTINPDVSLKVDVDDFGQCSVKFHLLPLSTVIDFEKANML